MSVNTLSTVPSADIDLTNTQSIVAAVIFPSIIRGRRQAAVKLSHICFITSETVKFAASSFIPVIGGSVSEAYSAVKGSIGVIRTSVGVIGVIIMSVIVAKPLLTLLAVKLAVWIGATINDIFGISNSGGLLKSINSVLSIGVSILAAYSIMFVISTSVVIMTAMNTGA